MAGYEEYKEVDLPWLHEIPSEWNLERIKLFLQESKDRVGSKSSDYTLLSLTLKGIIKRDMSEGKGKFPESFENYKVVLPGDIAFCLFDMDETPRTVGLSDYQGMLTGAYNIFHITGINPRYLYYYYLALDNVKALKPLYTGLRKTIDVNTFLSQKMPVPPRYEQNQIVSFLDWKISTIDKLIVIHRNEIKELESIKDIIISNTIHYGIKGTDLAESGINWLGKIPKNWQAIKIKWLFIEDDKRNEDGKSELLTFSKRKGLLPFSDVSDKQPSAADLTKYRLVTKGQLLENRMQAWHGMFICATRNGCVSPDYSVFNPSKSRYVNVKFYEYVFRSPIQVEQFAFASKGVGSGFNRLYTPAFGSIYTVYPPKDEQDCIVEFLDAKCKQIDEAVDLQQKSIEHLAELKTKIIADVVTGKIDVRDIVVPQYERVNVFDTSNVEDEEDLEII